MAKSYFELALEREVSPYWISDPVRAEDALEAYRAKLAKMVGAEYSVGLIDFLLNLLEKRSFSGV